MDLLPPHTHTQTITEEVTGTTHDLILLGVKWVAMVVSTRLTVDPRLLDPAPCNGQLLNVPLLVDTPDNLVLQLVLDPTPPLLVLVLRATFLSRLSTLPSSRPPLRCLTLVPRRLLPLGVQAEEQEAVVLHLAVPLAEGEAYLAQTSSLHLKEV